MVRYTEEEGKLICSFSHRLDSTNCVKWEEGLFEKIKEKNAAVVFDLNDVNYIASHFLRICLKVSKESGKGNFKIINAHDNVKKVFKMSNMEREFKIK